MDVRLAELDEDCQEELRHIIEAIQSKLKIDAEDDQIDQCVKNIVSMLPISVIELSRLPGMEDLVRNKWSADIILGITQHYHKLKRKLLSLLALKLRRKLDSEDKITVPSNTTYTEVGNDQHQDATITILDPMEMPGHSLKLNIDAKPFIPSITIKKEEADADDCMKITSKNLDVRKLKR